MNIGQCALSPDGNMLAVNHHDAQMTTLWNVQTRTILTRFRKSGFLFFSSDSQRLYACNNLKLTCYNISNLEIVFEWLHNEAFAPIIVPTASSYTETLSSIKKLSARGRFDYDIFIDTLSKNDAGNFTINSQKLGGNIHACFECVINPQATHIALVTDQCAYGPLFITVGDLEKKKTIQYKWMSNAEINSINFSPDATKLVIAATEIDKPSIVVIDLLTGHSVKLEQNQSAKYAAFVDSTTVLSILNDGTVSIYPLSEEIFMPINIVI